MVWIVEKDYPYEGTLVDSVWTSLEGAEYRKSILTKNPYNDYRVEIIKRPLEYI